MEPQGISRRTALKAIGIAAALPHLIGEAHAETRDRNRVHRIMTCNILLDLAEHKGKPEEWGAYRRELCMKVIKARKPDILCLQEVGRGQFGDFVTAFDTFDAFGFADPHIDKDPPRFQGIKNVILYSRERYEQTGAGTYWYSDTPLIAGSRIESENQPRHLNWLRLRELTSGKEFRVLNTHWGLLQPSRQRQAEILVGEAAQYGPEFPQLLCGDFNADRTSPEHKTLLDAGWKDTYQAIHGEGEPGFTGHGLKGPNRPPKEKGKIDFVFFRGNGKPLSAEIIRDGENGRFPSDHYFVSADMELA